MTSGANNNSEGNETERGKKRMNMVGRWMLFVYVNPARYYGAHTIEIKLNPSDANHAIRGTLAHTLLANGKIGNENIADSYLGVIDENTITFTTRRPNSTYAASITLNINEWSLDGTWFDNANQKGICKMVKLQKLK